MKGKKTDLSRRSFLQGAAVAVAGVAAAGVPTVANAGVKANYAPIGLPDSFDYEADVVIVGFGGAGAIAALTAADDGSSVILLESYPNDTATEVLHCPSTRYCGSLCVCALDAKDGSDALYSLSMGTTPRDICDVWGAGAAVAYDYWKSLGAEPNDLNLNRAEYPELPGNHTICTTSIPGSGPRLFQVLREHVLYRLADKIDVLWETKGARLIQNAENKDICGVVGVTADGKEVTVKAKKAVALCTGGFEWDEEMKQNFLRGYPSFFYTNPHNDGSGIRMGTAVGGALWHMNSISARAIPYHSDWEKGVGISRPQPNIFVTRYGKRWFYEYEWPSHNAWVEFVNFSSDTAEYKSAPAWIIYDDSSRKPLLGQNSKGRLDGTEENQYWKFREEMQDVETCVSLGWIKKGNTLEELAAEILKDPENGGRMDGALLAETVERYNHFCEIGEDEDFGREEDTLVPLATPPFYAIRIYPGGPNTQGGLKKDAKGHVMNMLDEPIPRLFCAGENGSVYGFLYPTGGGNVSEMTTFGQVIGHEMAAVTPWD